MAFHRMPSDKTTDFHLYIDDLDRCRPDSVVALLQG